MLTGVIKLKRAYKRLILLGIDIALVPIALVLSTTIQSSAVDPVRITALAPLAGALMFVAAPLALALRIPRIQLKAYEAQAAGRSAIFAAALAMVAIGLGWLLGSGLSWGHSVIFGMIFLALSITSRVVMLRILLALYAADVPRRRVLIYGAGTTGIQLASALKSDPGVVPVAFVDDSPALQGMRVAGLPVFSPVRIEKIGRTLRIDRVLIAMPSLSQPKQSQIARRIAQLGMEVHSLPSFAQLIGEEALIEKLAPVSAGNLLNRTHRDDSIRVGAEAYRARSVMISGAGGTIGAELCRQVLAFKPTRLVLLELSELALYNIEMELVDLAEANGVEIVPVLGSVADPRLVRRTLSSNAVEVVLHAAAYKHVPLVEANPAAGMSNNALGTAVLAQAAREQGVARFILISSDKAVRPTSMMGASKRLAELVVQDLASRSTGSRGGTIFSIVRFGNVLGSSGSVVPLFQEQVARGGPVTVTHPDVTRYFMTIREAVHLVLRAGSFATGGEVFVLDMGKPVPIRKLARQVIEAQGYSVRDADNPDGDIEIIYTGLRPGEKMYEELILSKGSVTTPHEKIFCAREDCLSELEVASVLQALRAAVDSGEAAAVRRIAARWIDGYNPTEISAAE